ncbi:replication protein A 70 kDa DNA-binding subunit B [Tanacetum coccineum]
MKNMKTKMLLVYVIGTVVGIGEIVAVNSIGSEKIRRKVVIEDEEQLPELLNFRHRYESRQEYDANQHKIQFVAHEEKMVTPQEFMNGAVKQLVGSIRETEPDTECVIYAAVHSIQYESGWAYLGCKQCSKKVEPVPTKGPSTSRTKQTWWCTKHESQEQVADRYKMIVRVMDESGTAQLCIFDGNMHKMSGFTAWELVEKYGPDTKTYFPKELDVIIGKRFLFRDSEEDSEEDMEDDMEDVMTTPAAPIKSTKFRDLSLTRKLQLQTPTSECIGSSSGHTSGSEKKHQRTIDHSIVVIDLSDSEYDTEDDGKEPNAKKPMVAENEEAIDQKAIVTVKKEKDVEQDDAQAVQKDEEPK